MSVTGAHDFFIQWHLTERCNLRCTHCYQTGSKSAELSFEEILNVIAEVDEMLKAWSDNYGLAFSPGFNITGGEPFLRPDIFEIISEISGRGFSTYLLTNGTLIDEEKAEALSCLGVKGVQVSIEGPEDVHVSIRGRGSFGRAVMGVSHLLDHGLTVTLNATLSQQNAGSFMDLVRIAGELGVQRLGFSRHVPSGRGKDMIRSALDRDAVRELYSKIFSMKPDKLEIVTGDPVASQLSCSPDGDSSVPSGGCAAGISGLTFLSDGTITPCRRMPLAIGNIKTDSLREVWAASEVLEALRDRTRYAEGCRTCRRWSICRGCRAIAYAWSQASGKDDFLADDPQCFIGAEQ